MADLEERPSGIRAVHDALSGSVGRRELLRAVAALGGGAGVATTLAPDDLLPAPGEEVSVVYGHARTDPADRTSLEPRMKTVPTEWYLGVQFAFGVRERLLRLDVSGVLNIAVDPGGYGSRTASLSVDVADETAAGRISTLVPPRIELDVDVLDEVLPFGNHPDADADPRYIDDLTDHRAPGGITCATDSSRGSLAPAMYDPADRSAFFATANHLFGKRGTKTTEHRGKSLYVVGEKGEAEIGTVRRGYPNEDFVRVEPRDDVAPSSGIEDPQSRPVVGQFTRIGLADLKARGERLQKVGAYSGHTTGEIKGVGGVTCFAGDVCRDGQLIWGREDTMTDGDSGSVTYRPDPEHPDEYVMVAGINNARTWWPGGNYTWGTAAYHLRDRYGYHF